MKEKAQKYSINTNKTKRRLFENKQTKKSNRQTSRKDDFFFK